MWGFSESGFHGMPVNVPCHRVLACNVTRWIQSPEKRSSRSSSNRPLRWLTSTSGAEHAPLRKAMGDDDAGH